MSKLPWVAWRMKSSSLYWSIGKKYFNSGGSISIICDLPYICAKHYYKTWIVTSRWWFLAVFFKCNQNKKGEKARGNKCVYITTLKFGMEWVCVMFLKYKHLLLQKLFSNVLVLPKMSFPIELTKTKLYQWYSTSMEHTPPPHFQAFITYV